MYRHVLTYWIILLVFGATIYLALHAGARLYPDPAPGAEVVRQAPHAPPENSGVGPVRPEAVGVFRVFLENLRHPLAVLLLQIITVLVAARVAGVVFRRVGQSAVIGEMLAGILLGPSLLGAAAPEAMSFLFPPQSMGALRLLSQLGVIIFMFVVGTEMNTQHIRRHAHVAVLVSHASIIIPFALGMAFCLVIYPAFAPPHVPFHAFALFMSVAMSITAFPVLARILEDNRMSRSLIGSMVIACAAVDDVTAWCLLAVVVAIVNASGWAGASLAVSLTLLFIGFMLFVFKPRAGRVLGRRLDDEEAPRRELTVSVLVLVFAFALFTEAVGIHALFGAFLAGVAMPSHPRVRPLLTERLEAIAVTFLLPLYFAFTGLRMQVGLLNDWKSWLVCLGLILIAISGKLFGSAAAARLTGMSWRDSLNIGVLMNTRGLIELIVLNIGFDLGVLSPQIYSMMVLMALTTTMMTGPLLLLLRSAEHRSPALMAKEDVPA